MAKHERPERIIFFINPISGELEKSFLPKLIHKFCRKCGIEFEIVDLELDTDIGAEIRRYKPDVAVAVGGDGTVNAVGRCLIHSEVRLGIIPMGSSNALAKNLHIPLIPEEALEVFDRYNIKPIDTLKINGHYCLHVCDLGFNANLIERFHKNKFRGMMSYAKSLFTELFRYGFFQYEVETPHEKLKGKAFSITITNTRYYGTMAAINPTGKINDGKFEICIIRRFPFISLPAMVYRLFNKTIHHSHHAIFIRTDRAVIYNPEKEGVHIDGENVEAPYELDIEMMHSSLKVAVPTGVN